MLVFLSDQHRKSLTVVWAAKSVIGGAGGFHGMQVGPGALGAAGRKCFGHV